MKTRLPVLAIGVLSLVTLLGAAPPREGERCLRGAFHGITVTDELGALVGREDRGDWGCLDGGSLPPISAAVPPVPPPTSTCLLPAYPNPLTSATRIGVTLPQAAHVNLKIWSRSTGHGPPRVEPARTLLDADLAAGVHQVVWNATDEAGVRVAPGVYRAVLEVNGAAICGDIEVL